MEINHIHEFIILAETCSFQETAEQTFISQSSLTKHIQGIEKELGTPLFDRTTRTVKLNSYGAEFYRYAKQIDLLTRDYKISIRNMLNEQSDRLTVAFQSRLGQYDIIQLLSRFQKKYPQYSLKMNESVQVVHFLNTGECDFVFSSEKTPSSGEIDEFIYRTDNLAVVLPANHLLAGETNISIKQLQNEKIIIHENTFQNMSWDMNRLQRYFSEIGLDITEVMTVNFSTNLVRMVKQGLGVGLINRLQIADDDDEDVVFIDISPAIPLQTKLMYHKQILRRPVAVAFIEFVKSQCKANTTLPETI